MITSTPKQGHHLTGEMEEKCSNGLPGNQIMKLGKLELEQEAESINLL